MMRVGYLRSVGIIGVIFNSLILIVSFIWRDELSNSSILNRVYTILARPGCLFFVKSAKDFNLAFADLFFSLQTKPKIIDIKHEAGDFNQVVGKWHCYGYSGYFINVYLSCNINFHWYRYGTTVGSYMI